MCGSDKTCGCGCEAKPSRGSARRERDVVLTDRQGRAFDRPRRADFGSEGEYLDAYDDYRRRVSDAMSSRGMQLAISNERPVYGRGEAASEALVSSRDLYAQAQQHGAALDRASARRARRDPSREPLIVGALYYLEWDAHDEGDEGTYVYNGVYSQTGADMFRRVSRVPSQRVVLYLFPHEVRYLELLARPRAAGPRGVPAPPSSAPRLRRAPELLPGRVLARPARAMPRVWDEGIVGPPIARAAKFQGFRRIDDEMFGVWSLNGVLYAHPRRP